MADWQYNEFRQIGVDFSDLQQVLKYDDREQTKLVEERALVQQLGIHAGQVVVEYGCGTGAFALAAAEAGAQVIATDVSKVMLAYAERRAAAAGLAVQFVHAGFLSYRHTAAPADVVVSKFALHHLPDFWKQQALGNIHALLRPRGVFYLQDVVYSFAPQDADAAIEDWIAAMAREDGSGFSRTDFEMHIREEHSTYAWVLEGMFARAGFTLREQQFDSPTYASYLVQKGTP
ncbi:MAG: class I SAM-dependent methyltransferase [Chloroflexota bacterium]|nr:class I SAM-dependent methyltransferase [Chloroflexota bacterium]